ncbi:hypothetical protein F1880_000249 [Penicillium rolfsii]|nr:hypothetical protein F1880_000249 [Penicillium rolfsii]
MAQKLLILGSLIPAITALATVAPVVSCVSQISPAQCTSMANSIQLEARAGPLQCDIFNAALGILKALGTPATSFCSSYLNVPSVTTVVGPTVTPAAITTDVYVTDVSTVTVYYPTDLRKRDLDTVHYAPVHAAEARAVPAALKLVAASQISAACSCLHITPKSTSTLTITAPTPVITDILTTDVALTVTTCNAKGGSCPGCDPFYCCGGACLCTDGGVAYNTCF